MGAFVDAVGVLFADPNLGVDALWRTGGAGPSLPVRVLLRRPDAIIGFGDARALMPSVLIEVRRSDVPEPAVDDSVEVAGKFYDVIAAPHVDSLNLIWTCEARERA